MNLIKKREKKQKVKTERNILPGVIFAGLATAIIVYAVMLNAEKNALSDFEKGSIYISTKEIPKGQIITEENIAEYFKLQELDVKIIPTNAIKHPEDLKGLITNYTIDDGTLITTGMFESVNDVTKDMKEPVIAGFKAEDLYQVVGGVLRTGDRIHIYKVDDKSEEMEGETTLVWENIFIADVFDQTGNRITSDDSLTAAQRINVYMDKSDVATFYQDLFTGSLRVVKECE